MTKEERSQTSLSPSILRPGKNCRQCENADRAAFLIDAADYFHAFRSAALEAERSIYIIGWDIDSRITLVKDEAADGFPLQLGEFLNALANRRKRLEIHILLWDFSVLFGLDREWFLPIKLDWSTHRRIHLEMDGKHPLGASHHQKIVVMDDTIAFAGGIDLTKQRWDTAAHKVRDSRRREPDGHLYRPNHDVQMLVSGDVAKVLGHFFRERWKMVSGKKIFAPTELDNVPWPDGVEHAVKDCLIGIARTRGEYNGEPGVREVEQLYIDAIKAADRLIYIENQYFTCQKIADALAARLREANGPEVIVIMPLSTDGWLSQYTMDLMRALAFEKLKKADVFNRLGIFYAYHQGLSQEDSIKIHSKVMVVDDKFLRIGSANLNNRSMGLDTECDLAVESGNRPDVRRAVNHFLATLLAEHLGEGIEKVREPIFGKGSVLAAIRAVQGGKRTLKDLDVPLSDTARHWLLKQDLIDPEKPLAVDDFVTKWFP